jgi:hypothetical protein
VKKELRKERISMKEEKEEQLTLKELAQHVEALHTLLASPQFGLFTWWSMAAKEVNAIAKFADKEVK